jgi:hypothetical protein
MTLVPAAASPARHGTACAGAASALPSAAIVTYVRPSPGRGDAAISLLAITCPRRPSTNSFISGSRASSGRCTRQSISASSVLRHRVDQRRLAILDSIAAAPCAFSDPRIRRVTGVCHERLREIALPPAWDAPCGRRHLVRALQVGVRMPASRRRLSQPSPSK